jgi:hypothetical protein
VVTSVTPSGWVPVDYGNVQVSVPATFSVLYPGWIDCGGVGVANALELGPPTASSVNCPAIRPNRKATTVQVLHGRSPLVLETKPSTVINRLSADPLVHDVGGKVLGYYVPALGMAITGSGPLAGTIFRTLTRSPRAVVLAQGPSPAVRSSWHTVTFQGLAFDAPQAWPVTRTALPGSDLGIACGIYGVTLPETKVTLSTDREPRPQYPCKATQGLLGPPLRQTEGVEVDARVASDFAFPLTFSTQCIDIHTLTACPATSPAFSILVLKVTMPGRTTAVLVSIGLAGNGMVARAILYSLRAA